MAAGVQAALDDPAVADREFDGSFGKNTFAGGVDQFICADLVVHAWDIARATGGDERLEPAKVHAPSEAMLTLEEAIRQPGACGPKVEPPADADAKPRFPCFLVTPDFTPPPDRLGAGVHGLRAK